MASVFRAQGSPSPTKMSNTLLPMEFDTAMSPIPARRQRLGQETENRNRGRQVGGEVGSILIQRGTKTADGAFSIFDDKPKNKRRWKEEDARSGRCPSPRPPHHHRDGSALHPTSRSSPALLHILFPLILGLFPCQFTLTCYDQTSHAVWDAGASRQEGDTHDDIWDPQCETDHSHLKRTKTDKSLPPIPTFKYSVLLPSPTGGHAQWCAG